MNPPPDVGALANQGWWLYLVAIVAASALLVTFSKNLREALGPAGRYLTRRKERSIERSMREQIAQDAYDEVRVADLRKQVTFFRDELAYVRDELASAREEARQSQAEARAAQAEAMRAQDEAREAQRLAAEAEEVHAEEMRTLNAALTEALARLEQLSTDVREVKNGQNRS